MDVQMPGMDGLEASRAICARWPPGRRPRIVAMTAEAMEGDRERCLMAGMDDYVAKPISLDDLRRALGQCRPLDSHTAEQGLTGEEATPRDPLDHGVLDQLREDLDDAAALRQVVAAFLERTPSMLTELRDAAARGDTAAILAAAHAVKGTSATLGALALSEQCAELERLARAGDMPEIVARVAAVETLYVAVDRDLRAKLGDSPS
jgi:CheY-like chemotaxis protein